MSGAICAIFIFSSPPGWILTGTYCGAKSSARPRAAAMKNHADPALCDSAFRVRHGGQKGDFGAAGIQPRVLHDDRNVGLEYRGIIGIARNRLRIIEIVEAEVQRASAGD